MERRVLFRSGIDADFIVIARAGLSCFPGGTAAQHHRQGDENPPGQRAHPVRIADTAVRTHPNCLLPQSSANRSTISGFMPFGRRKSSGAVNSGRLNPAATAIMKQLLLRMIEWRALALGGANAAAGAVWYNGRFIERWAGDEVVERLGTAFAHYNEADIWRALSNTLDLFGAVSRETAHRLGYRLSARRGAGDHRLGQCQISRPMNLLGRPSLNPRHG